MTTWRRSLLQRAEHFVAEYWALGRSTDSKTAAAKESITRLQRLLDLMDYISRQASGTFASTSGRSCPLHMNASALTRTSRMHRRPRIGRTLLASSMSSNWDQQRSWSAGLGHRQQGASFASAAVASLPAEVSTASETDSAPLEEILAVPVETIASFSTSTIVVEGTVDAIHYRCSKSAYTVLRLHVRPGSSLELPEPAEQDATVRNNPSNGARRRARSPSRTNRTQSVTVVGSLPQLTVGQVVRLTGSWTTHHQYGVQLKAVSMEELRPEGKGDVVAYLSGGIIPGVGPVIAKKLVDHFGKGILDLLDSPDAVQRLCKCRGIKSGRAESMKKAWDAGRNAREGSRFLTEAGIPAGLAQRVAERLGSKTKEIVATDPYAALGDTKLSVAKIDRVAAALGTPPDLVSRAAAVLERCLITAAEGEGHTYLPWARLEVEAKRLMEELDLKQRGYVVNGQGSIEQSRLLSIFDSLKLVARYMHAADRLVFEPPDSDSSDEISSHSTIAGRGAEESVGDLDEILAVVQRRLPGVTGPQLNAMANLYGAELPAILNQSAADALSSLIQCHRIGKKTAEKIKAQWDASVVDEALAAGDRTTRLRVGLRMADLEAKASELEDLPFQWGPGIKCYLPKLHAAEVVVATAAAEKVAFAKLPSSSRLARIRKWIIENQQANGIDLSAGQCAAIEAASDAPLLVITGGPGCGKTTVLQAIVKLWSAQGKIVHVCAPTGRAAQRMGTIQGIEPSTIHRLLGFQPRREAAEASSGTDVANDDASQDSSQAAGEMPDDLDLSKGGYFEYGASKKLDSNAVLVDEASMLSLPLAAAMFEALQAKTQLILVGDADQLPPIGPGGVLHSLIASGLVPVIDLREVFRQAAASAIVTSALAVRQGKMPPLRPAIPTPEALLSSGTDALLVRAPNPDTVPDLVYATVKAIASLSSSKNGYGGLVYSNDATAEPDLQVITPMRRGATGAVALNTKLQDLLNPADPQKPEVVRTSGSGTGAVTTRVFRVGDRVLQLMNNYEKDVFNGDQGYIVEVHPEERRVLVDFPQTGGRSSTFGHGVETLREYQGVELSQLDLAYAVTVHKAQGGEARHVVLALSPHHGRMLSRRLLYTGLTRARELLVVVAPGGVCDPIPVALARHGAADERMSGLLTRLQGQLLERNLKERTPVVFSNEAEVLEQSYENVEEEPQQPMHGPEGALCVLCRELELTPEHTAAVMNTGLDLFKSDMSHRIVDSESLKAHVTRLAASCGHSLPELPVLLRLAPLLLVASPDYFERGLAFALKLGPHTGHASQGSGLVDQLRRILSWAEDTK